MAAHGRDWLSEIDAIQRQMERLLEHYAGSKPPMVHFAKRAWEPAVDVYETTESVVVIVEIAGVDEENLQLTMERGNLVIRGNRPIPGAGTSRSYHQMEIVSGLFERIIQLPVPVDTEKAGASYNGGMLNITIPKSERGRSGRSRVAIRYGRRGSNG